MATKLRVSGLDSDFTEEQLMAVFTKHGTVESVEIYLDAKTGNSNGKALVKMASEDAQKAITGLHCKVVEGQKILVSQAAPTRR